MSNGAKLLEALEEVFDTESPVVFQSAPPATFSAPSVVVTPGDPFLVPDTHGLIRERWEVLVVVGIKERAIGIEQARAISVKVRNAISRAGGLWRLTTGPRVPEGDVSRSLVLFINELDFKTQE